jgi:hypothetical protein
MALPIAVPIAGGAAVLGLIALRLKKVSDENDALKNTNPSKPTNTGTLPSTPGVPSTPGIPNLPSTPANPSNGLATDVYAIVTTNDPPPMGDLIMRTAPNAGAPQVAGGGAEKGAVVKVITPDASRTEPGVWAEIQFYGGTRRPAARGFAKAAYLKPTTMPAGGVPVAPASPPDIVIPTLPDIPSLPGGLPVPPGNLLPQAVVTTKDAPPSGDLIVREGPGMSYRQIGGADKNGTVQVLNADASKTEPGVWAEIVWAGSNRTSPAGWPAVSGFVKKAYLKLI